MGAHSLLERPGRWKPGKPVGLLEKYTRQLRGIRLQMPVAVDDLGVFGALLGISGMDKSDPSKDQKRKPRLGGQVCGAVSPLF